MADTPKKEGILQTMVRPYVETYKGMTDPEYRYDNFPTTYEDYINKIVVNEDGINRITGKDREFYLNHEPTLNEFIRQKNMRADPAMASKLSGESGYGRFSRGATNALADTAQLAAILPNDLPGEFLDDVFTMENIGRLRRDYVVDEETAAKFDMTVDEANAFIRKHDQMASLGYFGALAASMPIEDILFRAAGSGLMKGGAFAGKKTGELLSDLKYLDEPDAGSLFLNTANTKPSSLGAASTKKINTSELNKLLSNKIPNFTPIDPRKFAPSQNKINLYENLKTILKPVSDPNRKIGVSYKDPTQKDIKKIEDIYKNRGQSPITTKTANNINILRTNKKFNEALNSGRLPDYADFTNLDMTAAQFNNAILRVLQKINGQKVLIPRDQTARMAGTFVDDPFVGLRKNTKQATKLLNEMANAPFNSPASKTLRTFAEDFINQTLSRPISYQTLVKKARSKLGTKGDDLSSLGVHEPVALSTGFIYKMPSYTNFIVPVTRRTNELILPQLQGRLSAQIGKYKNGDLTKKEFIKIYNEMLDAAIKKNPAIKGTVAKVMDSKKVTSYYGKSNIEKYKNFGMDLVGEADEAGFAFEIPKNKNNKLPLTLEEFVQQGNSMGGTPISRTFYADGDRVRTDYDIFKESDIDPIKPSTIPGTIQYAVAQALNPVQKDIRQIYEDRVSKISLLTEPYYDNLKLQQKNMEKILTQQLNPKQPTRFKLSELPLLITQNPAVTQATAGPKVPALEIIEFLYNGIRSGTENNIEMEKYFPKTYDMYERAKGAGKYKYSFGGVQETPKEQEFISMISEFNRAQASGAKRLMFSVVDLAAGITDTIVNAIDYIPSKIQGQSVIKTEFTDEVRRQFSEADLSEPETFLGKIGSIAIEYGIPGSAAIKFTNVLRKLVSTKKYSAFTHKTYGKGYKPLITEISNISKRSGSLGVAFGIGDFIASGPYNTLSTMFDDPLLSSKLVGKLEKTDDLSGIDLVKANFKNRLRFGAEGVMIGGVFPIVGPALGAIGKNVLLKPALAFGGVGVKATGAVLKGGTYLAANTPVVKDIGQGLARGGLDVASLLGKDIIARIGAGVLGGKGAFAASFKKGVAGQLPDYKDWRLFDVTSKDPLKKGLKKVDNFLKWFRDSGNQAVNKFYLDGGAERYITSKSKEIESYLDAIQKRSYDLAKGFENRYNKSTTSPAGEKYFMDQVLEFLQGGLKKSQLPEELQEYAQALKNTFDDIKKTYASELPMGGGLRESIESNLDKYMRMSFATFNNAAYKASPEVVNNAVDFMVNIIRKNEDLREVALKGSDLPGEQAIRNFAQQNVDSIIALGKTEGRDPLDVLNRINKEFVRNDDIIINTGEELPKVLRELLGQENNLRNSVMTTAGSLVTQTSNLRSWRETAKQGLRDGYLFETRAEATAAGIIEPLPIGRVPGLGLLESEALTSKGGPVGLYGSKEMVNTFLGTGGVLDSLLQVEMYQGLIAYKAAVQTGKTVFSPATQTRNFLSAGAFPMFNGHIGGGASVTDSFKIIMDDIFGAGKTVDEASLIKRTQRKVELGVLDENIVASELNAILEDLKKGSFKSFRDLAKAANNSKFYKQATRIYAGGDNVWKWYGHEFYMSQLKGVFKNFDEISSYLKNTHGVDIGTRNINTGSIKTFEDGIEEAAAILLRETYPTYSKVPEVIKALRKLPLGNFVSFTAEILRTGFATSSIAMKHIASDNVGLREMGYRSLAGQAITLGALNQGVQGIGYAMTNVTQTNVDSFKQFFAPDYMKNSTLVPTSNIKNGVFTVFDLSRFNPYDILISSANSLMASNERANVDTNLANKREEYLTLIDQGIDPSSEEMQARRKELKKLKIFYDANRKLDPSKIPTNVFESMFKTISPLWDATTGTFLSIPIGLEAFQEAKNGKTREGSVIWNEGMLDSEKFDKAMAHFFTTIEPGIVSTGKRIFNALQGDVSGSGQPIELNSEIIKLLGGSDVKIDIPANFDYKMGEFARSLVQPKMGRGFYSAKDWRQRGPEQIVKEYRVQNEQAFRQQYEFYKMVKNLRANRFMTDAKIITVLSGRGLSKLTVGAIMSGRYRAVSWGRGGLEGRYTKIKRNDPDARSYGFSYFHPFGALESEKNKWDYLSFEKFEEQNKKPEQQSAVEAPVTTQEISQAPPPVAPLPESKPVDVAAAQPAAGVVDQATGLTSTESALLDRDEQLIRQRQRGTV